MGIAATSSPTDPRDRSRRLRGALGGPFLALASVALTVAVLEIGFRLANFDFEFKEHAFRHIPIFYRQPTVPFGTAFFRRPGPDQWHGQVLNTMYWYLARNGGNWDGPDVYRDEAPVRIAYDRDGFRNPPDLEDWDIVVVGDSFTELGYLPDEELFTTRLGELLGLKVKNLGVAFTGTLTQTAYLTAFGRSPSTREAVVVFFEGNDPGDDFFERLAVEAPERPTTQPYLALQQRNLDALPRQTSFLRALHRLLTKATLGPEVPRRGWINAYFVGGGSETPLTLEFPESVPPTNLSAEIKETVERSIEEWGAAARSLGLRPWLAYMPCKRRVLDGYLRWQLAAHRTPVTLTSELPDWIQALAAGAGIGFIDLTPALRDETAAGRLTYNGIMDSHLNRLGSLTVSRALAKALEPAMVGR